MEISKEFQLFILNELLKVYPKSAIDHFGVLLAASKGESAEERLEYLCVHVKLLEDQGYIENSSITFDAYGVHGYNEAFTITTAGLVLLGVDLLNPKPNQKLVNQLMEAALQKYQVDQKKSGSLRAVLAALPQKTIEKLADKGLDALIALLFS